MAGTRCFLLEIGCEEMPSSPLMKAQEQLEKLVSKGLDDAGLPHGAVRTLSTPRRLAVMVEDCATATEEIHEVIRGPKTQIAFDAEGAPTRAAEGFARKNGMSASELVRRVDADGSEYVFAERSIPSIDAVTLLSELCERTIASIQWPNYRSQRWGSEHQTFVRPIRWICALLGGTVIPVSYAGVTSGGTTRGHRVLGAGEHPVPDAGGYEKVLESAFVLGEKRRAEIIREGIARIEAERDGARVDTPKGTFDEVVNLCEWPTVLVGTFDEVFLSVPHEIIVEAMLKHQRYFPIYAADGSLTREFVIVSNADPAVNDTVRAGNERVVRPRLDDAKFFYDEDLKVPMEEMLDRLGTITFQEKLGTVRQKVERMERIAEATANACGFEASDVALAVRAAHLAKADLVSQAVIEFTSQQGVMGGYYAEAAGEDPRVAAAVRDHYRPRFAGDALPEDAIGKVVAIADKLDTICGMFAINEPPTGSSDPYAVRRAAIGVIALLRELPSADFPELIECALSAYADQGIDFDADTVASDVESFFLGRLVQIAKGEGAAQDAIDAVSAVGVISPKEFLKRVSALEAARRESPELFADLSISYGRAANLGDASLGEDVDVELLGSAERELLAACMVGEDRVSKALADDDYESALACLAELRAPIDRFFEEVLVMDEDEAVRENRLRLLNKFVSVFRGLADMGVLSRNS